MSIGTNHIVSEYNVASSPLDATQELVVWRTRYTKAMEARGEKKVASMCVSVPRVSQLAASELATTHPAFIHALVAAQRNELVESLMSAGVRSIAEESISLAEVVRWYAEQHVDAERLTKELVIDWIAKYLKDELLVMIAIKVCPEGEPTAEQEATVNGLAIKVSELVAEIPRIKVAPSADWGVKMLKVLDLVAAIPEALTIQKKLIDSVEKAIVQEAKLKNSLDGLF